MPSRGKWIASAASRAAPQLRRGSALFKRLPPLELDVLQPVCGFLRVFLPDATSDMAVEIPSPSSRAQATSTILVLSAEARYASKAGILPVASLLFMTLIVAGGLPVASICLVWKSSSSIHEISFRAHSGCGALSETAHQNPPVKMPEPGIAAMPYLSGDFDRVAQM